MALWRPDARGAESSQPPGENGRQRERNAVATADAHAPAGGHSTQRPTRVPDGRLSKVDSHDASRRIAHYDRPSTNRSTDGQEEPDPSGPCITPRESLQAPHPHHHGHHHGHGSNRVGHPNHPPMMPAGPRTSTTGRHADRNQCGGPRRGWSGLFPYHPTSSRLTCAAAESHLRLAVHVRSVRFPRVRGYVCWRLGRVVPRGVRPAARPVRGSSRHG